MEFHQRENNRFGVEIKRDTVHAECTDFTYVLDAVDGHAGIVRVFDRLQQMLLFDGPVAEVRAQLRERSSHV